MELFVEVKDKVRLIRFTRPQRKNAMTFGMYVEVTKALTEANSDENTHIIVITGEGDYYSSGNDLNNYLNVQDTSVIEQACEMVRNYVAAFINCRKPLIALVNGPAIGIAATTLPLCDVVFASEKAYFKTPFSTLGLSPEGCSSYLFPKIMGYAKAAKMLYFSEPMNSQEALSVGLVTEVFPDELFQTKSWEKVREWVELPINSLIASKDLVRSQELALLHKANNEECDKLLTRITSEDCVEAALKFFTNKKAKV
jgi:peroxisomal 3,2-trans-enoyl-CoA isomerase